MGTAGLTVGFGDRGMAGVMASGQGASGRVPGKYSVCVSQVRP